MLSPLAQVYIILSVRGKAVLDAEKERKMIQAEDPEPP